MCRVIASVHRSPKRFLRFLPNGWTLMVLIETARSNPCRSSELGDVDSLRSQATLEGLLARPSPDRFDIRKSGGA